MKETKKLIFQIMGALLLLFSIFFFLLWTLNTFTASNDCGYYEYKGYVTSLYWDSIFLVCDIPLKYNDGNIVYVNARSLGDTFVIENYGVEKSK